MAGIACRTGITTAATFFLPGRIMLSPFYHAVF
jgi:hypothetical protein